LAHIEPRACASNAARVDDAHECMKITEVHYSSLDSCMSSKNTNALDTSIALGLLLSDQGRALDARACRVHGDCP